MSEFPEDLEKYAETAEFTETTVPSKITTIHDTKPGVWGKLVVLEGALDYIIIGPPLRKQRIDAGSFGVIEPTVPHRVDLLGPVRFTIEFWRSRDR